MPAYTSLIFDVHKSYGVEKLHIKISKCLLVLNAILSQLQI